MLVKTWDDKKIAVDLPSERLPSGDPPREENLLALPALIDPHVHFRTPGAEHKEDWATGATAALAGGVTTVLDMPNNTPSITTAELLERKKQIISEQLANSGLKIRPYFYFGATPDNLAEIEKVKDKIVGVKMFMGASTGNLLVADASAQEKVFQKCAQLNLVLAVHAEDDKIIQTNLARCHSERAQRAEESLNVKSHSKIRSRDVAIQAVSNAIALSKKYGTKLYILHASTAEEVDLIRAAKKANANIFAETTPHHLFLDESAYETLGTRAQMNPPLRTLADQEAIWRAINDGTIDTIGTDHAPHTLAEKSVAYPQSPSGVPGIETYLPLLLNEYNKGKITIEKIVQLTRLNPEKIFGLPPNNDWVIVDLNLEKIVEEKNLKTKCGWSPFAGWVLKGWPIATITNNQTLFVIPSEVP